MNAHEPTDRRLGRSCMLVFALLAAGILATGYLYYRNYERHYRSDAERQLSTIAELKVGELTQYRNERLGDANILNHNPAFSQLVRRFLEQPEDANAQRQLHTWLGKYQAHYQYDRVFLLDIQGVLRMSAPASPMPVASVISARVPEILRSGQAAFQDFYRLEQNQRVYLSVLVPLRDEADGNRPLGVLVMRIDPETYLYPFIQRWPVPSKTAETLLVRREGNEVVFLNELRFQTNTVLTLRAPLDRKEQPAVMAALGTGGIVEGRDYRGVPVIAAVRAVSDSPWSLVAKMDTAEMYAPLRERLWLTVFLVAALLIGTGAGTGLLWRQQRVRFYRERAESAETLRASEVRYRWLFESAKDGILILDAETGVVVDVNPFLIKLLGFSREAFLGKKIWELGFFKNIAASQADFAELLQKGSIRYEDKPLETADGRRIEVEFVSNVYEVNHKKVVQCNVRDVTERKREEEAQQLAHQRLRRFVDSNVVGIVIVNAAGDIIEANDYYLRLIGYTREELEHGKADWRAVTPSEWLPADEQALRELRERGTCTPYEKEYVRRDGTRVPVFLADTMLPGPGEQIAAFALDLTARKQTEAALQREFAMRSMLLENLPCIAMVLRKGTREIVFLNEAARLAGRAPGKTCYGTRARSDPCPFCLAPEVWATNQPRKLEVECQGKHYEGRWVPLTDDLYVHYIFDITARKQTEAAVRNREGVLQQIFDLLPVGLWFADKDGKLLRGNPAGVKIWGAELKVDPSEYGVFKARRLPSGEEVAPDDWALAHTIRDKVTIVDELLEIDAFDGTKKTILNYTAPVLDAQGDVQGAIVVNLDITERKQAEESLRVLSLRLSRAQDKERRRIARELHDSTGQKLAALSMTVGLLQDATSAPDGQTEKMFADCLAMIEQCSQEIRTHSYLLHPPLLDELGLATAISDYVEGFSKRSGVQVALDAPPDLVRLPTEVEIALFRVVQESLGNIHRHAGASIARIRLACDAEQVTLEVSDQGRGLPAETIRAIETGRGSAGVGIAGMRERLRLLGGRLEIESGGQGTTVRAIVPRRAEDG